MIELITGSPGAGKTTFAVATRLAAEAVREITVEDGTRVKRRLVCAGFRGLKVEHEKLPHKLTGEVTPTSEVNEWNKMQADADGAPVHERLPGDPARDVPAIVQNWWLWCQPGDLIAIDEVQFIAERTTLGRKPPVWIQKLEVHRHYGVDFLIVTQHPQLIDTTIRALVGLHRHVRAVMGSPVCMVYTWDHASNPERYNMANKGTFVRRAKHYRLFHSSVAHVKPPTSGRWALAVVPVLLVIFGVGFSSKVSGWISGGKPKAGEGAAAVAAPAKLAALSPLEPRRPAGFLDVPALQGCYTVGQRCECIGENGRPVRIELAMCRTSAGSFDGLVAWAPRKLPATDQLPKSPPPPAGAASSALPLKL